MKLLFFLLFSLLISCNSCFAENIKTSKDFRKVINEIRKLQPSKYQKLVKNLKKKVLKFIFYKRGFCNGEFSSIVLLNKKTIKIVDKKNKSKKTRLSKLEKNQCLKTLLKDQISYTRSLFDAQKKYIKYFNKIELAKLDESNENMIQKLKAELVIISNIKLKHRKLKIKKKGN